MNKLLLLSTVLFYTFFINAQNVSIPDPNFKAALLSHNPVIDSNGDGEIQVSEANAFIGGIDVHYQSISNLTGIEAFTALTSLNCSGNQFTTLDLSSNTDLIELESKYNQLTTLDISNNTALTSLNCYDGELASLDVSNNTALTSLNCFGNQLISLDLSNNTALTELICNGNSLTTLDLSNNNNLTLLSCIGNQLTTLDLSNNTALAELYCSQNPLTTLNLSNNTALTLLYCSSNQLTTLNLSNNTALTRLNCSSNQLTTLDLSNNTALTLLYCSSNQLTTLDLRNGNNTIITSFSAQNNPNLYCIQVDDPEWSQYYWNYDTLATYTYTYAENCLYGITEPNIISGNILKDNNCILDANPQGIENVIVRTEPEYFYGITDSLGSYKIYTDTGTYLVNQIITNPLVTQLCPMPNYYTVHFDSLAQDTTELNFYNEALECPLLTIGLSSDRRRRCFTNNTILEYCNDGFADATGVEVVVKLPEYVEFVSADYVSTIDADGNYVFDIGMLAQGDCGTIHIIDSIACIEDITGLTQCTKVWITPQNDCLDSLNTDFNAWDHSSVMVVGECFNDTIVRFTISNTGEYGDGDMENPQEYRIYVDNALAITESFQLNGGESINIDYFANGQTVRLEADQHPEHPGNSHPQATIEGCGNYGGAISMGFVNNMPMDDADYDIEIECMEIIDSYDPNDKSVSPSGITNNHYLETGTLLDYQIRFQNTGSDTAFAVVVVDTLSPHLNPSTIQWGLSSHPYTVDVTGMETPTLRFTFNNIDLPDSATNELASHGFIKYKVAPYDTLANGTEINNTAYIYFDYNMPIVTNTAQIIISDTVLTYSPLLVETLSMENINIYPNPTSGKVIIEAKNIERIEIYDLSGVLMKSTKQKIIDISSHAKGIYFVKIVTINGAVTRKILLE